MDSISAHAPACFSIALCLLRCVQTTLQPDMVIPGMNMVITEVQISAAQKLRNIEQVGTCKHIDPVWLTKYLSGRVRQSTTSTCSPDAAA
jgi:hypothetical protein